MGVTDNALTFVIDLTDQKFIGNGSRREIINGICNAGALSVPRPGGSSNQCSKQPIVNRRTANDVHFLFHCGDISVVDVTPAFYLPTKAVKKSFTACSYADSISGIAASMASSLLTQPVSAWKLACFGSCSFEPST